MGPFHGLFPEPGGRFARVLRSWTGNLTIPLPDREKTHNNGSVSLESVKLIQEEVLKHLSLYITTFF